MTKCNLRHAGVRFRGSDEVVPGLLPLHRVAAEIPTSRFKAINLTLLHFVHDHFGNFMHKQKALSPVSGERAYQPERDLVVVVGLWRVQRC